MSALVITRPTGLAIGMLSSSLGLATGMLSSCRELSTAVAVATSAATAGKDGVTTTAAGVAVAVAGVGTTLVALVLAILAAVALLLTGLLHVWLPKQVCLSQEGSAAEQEVQTTNKHERKGSDPRLLLMGLETSLSNLIYPCTNFRPPTFVKM